MCWLVHKCACVPPKNSAQKINGWPGQKKVFPHDCVYTVLRKQVNGESFVPGLPFFENEIIALVWGGAYANYTINN